MSDELRLRFDPELSFESRIFWNLLPVLCFSPGGFILNWICNNALVCVMLIRHKNSFG